MLSFSPADASEAPYASDKLMIALLHFQAYIQKMLCTFTSVDNAVFASAYRFVTIQGSIKQLVAEHKGFLKQRDGVAYCGAKDKQRTEKYVLYFNTLTDSLLKIAAAELDERDRLLLQQQFCERMLMEGYGAFSHADLGGDYYSEAEKNYTVCPIQKLRDSPLLAIIKWVQMTLQLEGDERFNCFCEHSAAYNGCMITAYVVANATRDVFFEGDKVIRGSASAQVTEYSNCRIRWKEGTRKMRYLYLDELVKMGITKAATMYRLAKLPE